MTEENLELAKKTTLKAYCVNLEDNVLVKFCFFFKGTEIYINQHNNTNNNNRETHTHMSRLIRDMKDILAIALLGKTLKNSVRHCVRHCFLAFPIAAYIIKQRRTKIFSERHY